MASDGAGGVILVWYDYRTGTSDLYAQRISSSGQRLWSNDHRISKSILPTTREAMRVDGYGGEFWVTWNENRDYPGHYDVYLQKLDANGQPLWSQDVKVGQALGQDQYQPVVTVDPSGDSVVAWVDRRNVSSDLFAQRFSPSGQPTWAQDVAAVHTSKFYAESGDAVSKKINATNQLILRATLQPKFNSYDGSVNFYLSNNGGTNWQQVKAR